MGKRYAIYAEPHPKREGEVVFVNYVNRKRYDGMLWQSFEGAVGSILDDFPGFSMDYFCELHS